MGRKLGLSFSWKRASGLSALKGKVARSTGIPMTRAGIERKVGRTVLSGCSTWWALIALLSLAVLLIR